jgi:vacuolar protein sorting-associated protein 13A/C
MTQAGSTLTVTVLCGPTWIVPCVDPYKGAQKEGLLGFGKGLVRGVAGVVAKPTSGAVAFASQTLHGVANTGDFLTSTAVRPQHMRPQRFIAPNSGLTRYERQQAQQHEINEKARLKRIRKGKETGNSAQ